MLRCHVSWHSIGVVALGRSDSGGRHTSRRRGCDRGGDRRERREAQRLIVGHDDAGAWWAAARCGRVR
jgi:hypothetical protein